MLFSVSVFTVFFFLASSRLRHKFTQEKHRLCRKRLRNAEIKKNKRILFFFFIRSFCGTSLSSSFSYLFLLTFCAWHFVFFLLIQFSVFSPFLFVSLFLSFFFYIFFSFVFFFFCNSVIVPSGAVVRFLSSFFFFVLSFCVVRTAAFFSSHSPSFSSCVSSCVSSFVFLFQKRPPSRPAGLYR